MKERIEKFLYRESLSPAKFADEIGVQRSSVSHVLSGRNLPSFDFIQKMLSRYKNLNAEWLILGTGEMYKQKEIFKVEPIPETRPAENIIAESKKPATEADTQITDLPIEKEAGSVVEKIVVFYTNKTFKEYLPGS